jgi:hypothetical protein
MARRLFVGSASVPTVGMTKAASNLCNVRGIKVLR